MLCVRVVGALILLPFLFLGSRSGWTRVVVGVAHLGIGELPAEVILCGVGGVEDPLRHSTEQLLDRRPINSRAVALGRMWVVRIASRGDGVIQVSVLVVHIGKLVSILLR